MSGQRRGGSKSRRARADRLRGTLLRAPEGPSAAKRLQSAAHHLTAGAALLRSGQLETARQCFLDAVRADPADAVAHNCLGIVARLQRQPAAAVRYFEQALLLAPQLAEAHNNLGNALRDLGQIDEATGSYRRAIALKPEFAEAHNNLGVVLLARDQTAAAITAFERALRLNSTYTAAWNNLGNACHTAGQLDAARAHFMAALRHAPESAEVHNNLANVLRELGDLAAARQHYESALQQQPQLIEVYENLGSVQVELEDLAGAVETYRRACELRPDSAPTLVHLGNVYRLRGETDAARAAYGRAQRLDPANRSLRLRTAALCPVVFPSREAVQKYRDESLIEWQQLAELPWGAGGEAVTARLAEPPFELQFLHGDLRPHREAFARIYAGRFPPVSLPPRRRRPRLGLVVTRSHEGIFLKSMRGLIERLPPGLADVVLVCPRSSVEPLRRAIHREVEFLPLARQFAQIQEEIRQAAFDVLYYWEIGTDATNYFLPFLRLAPVQCTAWGYQTTSGIANVDYYLSSALIEPDDADTHYSETLLRASTLLTWQERPEHASPAETRSRCGIPRDRHVYLCPHQLGKFHPDFDEPLAAVLRRDPQGEVVILEDRHAVASAQLAARLQRTMPDVLERVRFLPRQSRQAYLDLIAAAEVVLDPPHFSGANTTYDALGLGKAVVTQPAAFRRGSFTLACCRKIGFEELVVHDQQGYVDLAVQLATEPDRRDELESRLRQASVDLFEDPVAVAEFTRIIAQLVQVARDLCRGGGQ